MTERTPLLVVGDGPTEPTGLGRIARDLCGLIHPSDLPVELVQVGGDLLPLWRDWEHLPLERGEDWGAKAVEAIYRSRFGSQPGILWAIWDPGRLYPYTQIDLPVQRWCYTAVDAENRSGVLSGPARAALQQFDRVLAYGRWASQVLRRTLNRPVEYLPHGIQPEVWQQTDDQFAVQALGPYRKQDAVVVGSVMTNQPRKDHAIYCEVLRRLLDRGLNVFGWLHTDIAVKAWSLPQLVEDYGLERRIQITAYAMTDQELSAMYHACDLVVLPTLGEGFGYPIVEALAAGTIVVHGHCAGGAELLPKTEWRVPVRRTRIEGIYALQRPVWEAEDWVNACLRALDWREKVGRRVSQAYCRGAVAHLDWQALWPRWRSWIRRGL